MESIVMNMVVYVGVAIGAALGSHRSNRPLGICGNCCWTCGLVKR